MALFSFRHSVKTFSPKCTKNIRTAKVGQTAAHLRYITRIQAARVVVRARLDQPIDTAQACYAEKIAMARRGRVCERFIIALPHEATEAQREILAQRFAEELTNGKAGYIFAVHDKTGNDVNNPHFHLVAFDKHIKAGGRGRPSSVIGMARKHAIEKWAARWADIHNQMMLEWGYGPECQISHLSYKKRGIDLIPEIHEGSASRKMRSRGLDVTSKSEWKTLDLGHSRAEANIIIREINKFKTEIKNDQSHRLGSGNERNPNESERCRSPVSKGCRGYRKRSVEFGSPNQRPNPSQQELRANRTAPWLAGGGTEPAIAPVRTTPNIKANCLSYAPAIRSNRLSSGERGVRRIFLELVMLRDTLLARLAAIKYRRHRLATDKVPDRQHETPKLLPTQKGSNIER